MMDARALLPAALLLLAAGARAETPAVFGGALEGFPRFERRQAASPETRHALLPPRLRLVAADPSQQADMDRVAAAMMRSPLARELAAELVVQDRAFTVLFDERLGGRVVGDDIDGTHGSFSPEKGFLVRLAAPLRDQSRESAAAGTLAHELLGHGLRYLRLGPDARRKSDKHAGDETLARLIGATVRMELGDFAEAPAVRALAADLAAAEEGRSRAVRSYLFDLSAEQMRDATGAYRRRLTALRGELADARGTLPSLGLYEAAVEHFVSAHSEPASAFAEERAELDAAREATEREAARLERAVYLLEGVVGLAESGGLDPSPAELARRASHPIVLDTERRVESLLPRALALAGAPPRAVPAAVRAPGLTRLGERIKADLETHAAFWRETAERLQPR